MRKRAHRKMIVITAILGASVGALSACAQSLPDLARRFLSPGEHLLDAQPEGSAKTIGKYAIVQGHFSQDRTSDIAFVIQRSGGIGVRVVLNVTARPHSLDYDLEGTYLWPEEFAPTGFALKDIDSDGLDELVVISAAGASVGPQLYILGVRAGQLTNLEAELIGGYRFTMKLSNSPRIVAYDRWTDPTHARVWVYDWDGARFVLTDKDSNLYVQQEVDRLAAEASADTSITPMRRATLANTAISILIQERRFPKALQLCSDVMAIISQPARNALPTLSPLDRNKKPDSEAARQLAGAKIALHRLSGDVYRATGDLEHAKVEYTFASELEHEINKDH